MGSSPLAQEFDLTRDAERERMSFRRIYRPFVYIVLAFGATLIALGPLTWAGYVSGTTPEAVGGIVGGGGLILFYVWLSAHAVGQEVLRLRVDSTGLALGLRNGRTRRLMWNDPQLMIDLGEFTQDQSAVLPLGDARNHVPRWMTVMNKSKWNLWLETTLPRSAYETTLGTATTRLPRTRSSRVAFFWWTPPKAPGELRCRDELHLKAGEQSNGVLTRIRGESVLTEDPLLLNA